MKKFFINYRTEILLFAFFVLIHLPGLGHDNFNTDVWKWKQRSYDFGTGFYGLDFEKTFQKYHPGVTLMWVGSTAVKITNFIAFNLLSEQYTDAIKQIFLLDFWQKFLLVIVIGLSYVFAFRAARTIIGTGYSVLAFVSLALEPFYLGLTRVFHLEGLMSTLMLASVLWLYSFFLDSSKYRRLVISGVFGGLAVLTKTSALFLIPFTAYAVIFFSGLISVEFLKKKITLAGAKKPAAIFLLWLVILIASFFMLWPVLWVNPGYALKGLYQGIAVVGIETDHQQFYFGNLVDSPDASYYFVVLALKSSPYILLGFFLSLYLIFRGPDKGLKRFTLFLFSYIALYLAVITLPSKKLDRYILPSMLAMSLISTYSIYYLIKKLSILKSGNPLSTQNTQSPFTRCFKTVINIICNRLNIFLAFMFILPAVFTVYLLKLDFLSYYNPIFGGLETGMFILEPKWLIGKDEIMSYFLNIKSERGFIDAPKDKPYEELIYKKDYIDKVLTVAFQEKYYTQIWPFFREQNSWAVINKLRPFAVKTRFFVFPVWNDEAHLENRFVLKYNGKISIRGTPAYNVYERVY